MNNLLDPDKFELITGAAPDGDLIFTSTDSRGTPGALNQYVTQKLGYPKSLMPDEKDLARGFAIWEAGDRKLAFVVTVGHGSSLAALEENLDGALSSALSAKIGSIWIPLMGTGAGGLSHLESLKTTVKVLQRHLGSVAPNARITISLPQSLSEAEYAALYTAAYGTQYPRQPILQSLDQEVHDLIHASAVLLKLRNEPVPEVTTTVFFLTLTVADILKWSGTDRMPQIAKRFAQFVRGRGAGEYASLWSEYFRVTVNDLTELDIGPAPNQPILSRNLIYWANLARDQAKLRSRSRASLDDFIRVLSTQLRGNVGRAVARLGVAVKDFYNQTSSAAGQHLQNRDPVTRRMLNDQATLDDKLGFSRYVDAMAQFILSDQTSGPLSISIEAPWGYGKSSLMAQLRNRLDPARQDKKGGQEGTATFRRAKEILFGKREYTDGWAKDNANKDILKAETWTVWFNAWKYESSEQVWSGLMDALVKEISARLPPAERELFLFRLNLSRIDDGLVRRRVHERLAEAGWGVIKWGLAGLAGLVPVTLALKAYGHDINHIPAVTVLGVAISAVTYFLRRKKILDEPAKFSLSDFFRIPDYQKNSGILHQIQADLDNVLTLATQLHRAAGGSSFRIVVFVDDLDRCAPGKIASVVEGISSFLAGDRSEFFFVIGMDPQIVASALDNAHKDLRTQLPQLYRETPLGWRFMDKFIQLPFTIPARHQEYTDNYLAAICATQATVSDLRKNSATGDISNAPANRRATNSGISTSDDRSNDDATTLPPIDSPTLHSRLSETVMAENVDVRTVMNDVMSRSHCSPREIKRILNLVRFVLHLRVARIISEKKVPPLAAYASWIVLGLRWPELVRWLEWGFGELHSTDDLALKNRLARRLHSFESLAAAHAFDDWGKELRLQLNKTDEVLWTQDRTLYRFLQEEAQRNHDARLSTAAEVGLF